MSMFEFGPNWMLWAIAILVILPILLVALGEITAAIKSTSNKSFLLPVSILKNGLVPLALIVILLRQVVGYPTDHLAVKIADTGAWIVAINFVLALINASVVSDAESTGTFRLPKLLLDLMRFLFVALGSAVVISVVWGVDLGSLITALGVGSIVIGLALQDTLGNLFSGLSLITTQNARVGDWLRVGERDGRVVGLNWRAITIITRRGDRVVIPNGQAAKEAMTVLGGSAAMNVSFEITISYFNPPDEVMAFMREAGRRTPLLDQQREVEVYVDKLDEFAINYKIYLPVRDMADGERAATEFFTNFWYIARRNDVVFPAEYHIDYKIPDEFRPKPRRTPEEVARIIDDSGTFPVEVEELIELSSNAILQRYRADETIVALAQAAPAVFVVISGHAVAAQLQADGEQPAHTFGRGEIIMYDGQLAGTEAPMRVKATTALEVVAIPRNDFKEFLTQRPGLGESIEEMMTQHGRLIRSRSGGEQDDSAQETGHDRRLEVLKQMFRTG